MSREDADMYFRGMSPTQRRLAWTLMGRHVDVDEDSEQLKDSGALAEFAEGQGRIEQYADVVATVQSITDVMLEIQRGTALAQEANGTAPRGFAGREESFTDALPQEQLEGLRTAPSGSDDDFDVATTAPDATAAAADNPQGEKPVGTSVAGVRSKAARTP